MRTMKKVIALSLVLAMALSMMATAAFKDQEAINEDLTGDISLMVALNVFNEQGTGAGYFEPNRELTREEVAKLVYVLKNKGVDNGATSWTGMNIFKDIEAGRWSEGYINYCASTGMIAGTGEGYFNPTAKMSAVEVAKLLLVLNGYKADVQGYVGSNWDVNIIRDAEAAGIFSNYDLPVRGSVTREWVARLMNNGINTTKVKYEDGQAVEMYNKEDGVYTAVTFAKQDLGLVETTGILTATPNAKLVDGTGTVANGGKANCKLDSGETFKYDAPLSLLGQKVTVLSKGALNTTNKVYGVTTHKDNIVTTTTVDAVKWDTEKFEAANKFKFYEDFKTTTKTAAELKEIFGKKDGRTITLVDYNNNGKYDAAFVKSVVYAKIDYINPANNIVRFGDKTTNATLANVDGKDAYSKLVFEDTVAKGDIVKVTKDFATGKALTVIQKVDVVTGAVSKITNGVATIDGNEYSLSVKHIDKYDEIDVSPKALNYYVDGKYVVYSNAISEEVAEQTNIAYVIATTDGQKDEWGKENKKVDIIKNDGTREVLTYKDGVEKAMTFEEAKAAKGQLVEYVMSGGKVYFNTLKDTKAVSDHEFKKSAGTFSNASEKFPVNDNTYFFVVDGDNYAVVTASEMKGNMKAKADTTFAVSGSGLPYVKYAVLAGKVNSDASEGVAVSATNISTELDEDGNTIHKLVVTKLDGTEVTLISDNKTYFTGKTGKFVKYEIGSSGKIENAGDITVALEGFTAGALTVVDGNAVMIDNDGNIKGGAAPGYMTLADDVKIYYVDAYKSNDKNVVIVSEGEGLVESAETAENTFAKSVLYKTKSGDDKVITEIIVEVDGQNIPSALYGA